MSVVRSSPRESASAFVQSGGAAAVAMKTPLSVRALDTERPAAGDAAAEPLDAEGACDVAQPASSATATARLRAMLLTNFLDDLLQTLDEALGRELLGVGTQRRRIVPARIERSQDLRERLRRLLVEELPGTPGNHGLERAAGSVCNGRPPCGGRLQRHQTVVFHPRQQDDPRIADEHAQGVVLYVPEHRGRRTLRGLP